MNCCNTIHAETMSMDKAAISGARDGNDSHTGGIVCAQALPLISPPPLCDRCWGSARAMDRGRRFVWRSLFIVWPPNKRTVSLCSFRKSPATNRRSPTLGRSEQTHMISLRNIYGFWRIAFAVSAESPFASPKQFFRTHLGRSFNEAVLARRGERGRGTECDNKHPECIHSADVWSVNFDESHPIDYAPKKTRLSVCEHTKCY